MKSLIPTLAICATTLLLSSCEGEINSGLNLGDNLPLNFTLSQDNVVSSYSFDSVADRNDPEAAGGSASLYAPNNHTSTRYGGLDSWNNNHFIRIQLRDIQSVNEQDDAGVLLPLNQHNISATMSIGWIARFGSTFFNSFIIGNDNRNADNKIVMMRIGDGTTVVHGDSPQMITSAAHNSDIYHVPQISSSPNNDGRKDAFGRDYPINFNDDHAFNFEAFANQWVYYEITSNATYDIVILSVSTRDGAVYSFPLATTQSNTAQSTYRELHEFRFIAYLHGVEGADPESYADISDMYVGNGVMGPPPGFVQ
ncbi:MAG: hypothetical protein OQK98_06165 [Gammaproteobacteria bacterium]|nr:hypothetical protein [Gammaproteobacteria bacterium]